ncbi:MAG: dihydrolipoamide acetyltransferase family protein [Gordonia sp. (in: high G+C Gram-positive bacteria)]|uniref:dihydrolipoamide acetyltransferase family protein n=1 Tax=Gordonia sp. (in: high G+C Gram-positive bacteria) TaxID=84139 RepID=UPI003BB4A229
MTATETFHLPDLGEGLTDAELVRWDVAIGDVIELNQVIAEVETAKAAVELPSPFAGTVVALHAAAGTVLDVGAPLIEVEINSSPSAADGPRRVADDETPTRTPVLVGYGVAADAKSRRRSRSSATEPTSPPPPAASEPPVPVERAKRVESTRPLAAPPIRQAARDADIDLADVTPTGTHGEVTRDDLNRFRDSAPGSSSSGSVTTGRETRTPIHGVRRRTAEAMVASAFTAPHVTEFVDVDVTATMDLVAKLGAHKDFANARLTPLALVAKALLVALRENPSLNSSWDEVAGEIVTKHYVNLGIAAATGRGLLVPNLKDAQTLPLRDLAAALTVLTAIAKDGRTPPADLVGGTITITNIGVFGIDAGTPILNPGEAAILCFGAVRRRPWEYDGTIALRQVTTLSLSFDHRLVDGEQGSRFLAAIAGFLADPLTLLGYV